MRPPQPAATALGLQQHGGGEIERNKLGLPIAAHQLLHLPPGSRPGVQHDVRLELDHIQTLDHAPADFPLQHGAVVVTRGGTTEGGATAIALSNRPSCSAPTSPKSFSTTFPPKENPATVNGVPLAPLPPLALEHGEIPPSLEWAWQGAASYSFGPIRKAS